MLGPHKVTAPIARSTAYDFNCHLSKSHTGDPRSHAQRGDSAFKADDLESRNVMPHEFLFEEIHTRSGNAARMRAKSSLNGVTMDPRAVSRINDAVKQNLGNAHSFTTAAGRKRMYNQLKEENILASESPDVRIKAINNAINAAVYYIGVAITGIVGGPNTAQQRQGFSATRGGLMTIMHRGKSIPAGSRVAMEFDVRDILDAEHGNGVVQNGAGVPRTKIMPRLVKVDDSLDALDDLNQAAGAIVVDHDVPTGIQWVMSDPMFMGRSSNEFVPLQA